MKVKNLPAVVASLEELQKAVAAVLEMEASEREIDSALWSLDGQVHDVIAEWVDAL